MKRDWLILRTRNRVGPRNATKFCEQAVRLQPAPQGCTPHPPDREQHNCTRPLHTTTYCMGPLSGSMHHRTTAGLVPARAPAMPCHYVLQAVLHRGLHPCSQRSRRAASGCWDIMYRLIVGPSMKPAPHVVKGVSQRVRRTAKPPLHHALWQCRCSHCWVLIAAWARDLSSINCHVGTAAYQRCPLHQSPTFLSGFPGTLQPPHPSAPCPWCSGTCAAADCGTT